MTPPTAHPGPTLDPAGRLDADVACLRCGYNLRGIGLNAACPECGLPVGRSARGDLLQFAPPAWVERLARSVIWASITLALGVIGVIALFSLDPRTPAQWAIAFCIIGAPTIVGLIACWMFTTPEPRSLKDESSWSPRRITRYSAAVSASLLMGGIALVAIQVPWRSQLIFVLLVIGVPVATAGVAAAGFVGAGLARRIPNRLLAWQSLFVGLGSAAVGGSACGGFLILELISMTRFEPLPPWVTSMTILGVLITLGAFVIFGVWTLSLISAFTKEFGQAAKAARETWARAGF